MQAGRTGASFDLLAALVAAALVASAACGPSDGGRVVPPESGATDIVVARPSFTLTATDGTPFDFAARTAGRLTFLEFGYTNCPDVCPVHMANLSAVMRNLTPTERMRIDVVFVSVDPDRDSLPALRKWLDAFDATFIGLTGTSEDINAAQAAVGFGPAIIQVADDGSTIVSHAAPVLAFTADDTAHVMYPFGTRQADWVRDIPRLLSKRGTRDRGVFAGASAAMADRSVVERAYVVIPVGAGPAAIYFVARNPTSLPDTIVAIDVGAIGNASLHMTMEGPTSGTATMHAVDAAEVPARGMFRLSPGGYHGMIAPVTRTLVRGERLPVGVRFARAGTVRVDATVITYADLDTATAARPQ
ncbi:MAG: SCO family protein [Gemmatimonadetes bacterium]|nr:SCO family protein [Gemmatimonadota bacterium]